MRRSALSKLFGRNDCALGLRHSRADRALPGSAAASRIRRCERERTIYSCRGGNTQKKRFRRPGRRHSGHPGATTLQKGDSSTHFCHRAGQFIASSPYPMIAGSHIRARRRTRAPAQRDSTPACRKGDRCSPASNIVQRHGPAKFCCRRPVRRPRPLNIGFKVLRPRVIARERGSPCCDGIFERG
jgi:hypothetical protein